MSGTAQQRRLRRLGKALREARNKRGLSQRDVETSTGVSHSYLSQLERGEHGVLPSLRILDALERFYEQSFTGLLRPTSASSKD